MVYLACRHAHFGTWYLHLSFVSLPDLLLPNVTRPRYTIRVSALLSYLKYHPLNVRSNSMCYDHLLPIFFQDDRSDEVSILSNPATGLFHVPGGLGLRTKDVGIIMSVNGLIALFIQAVIFPFVAEKIGIFRVFVLVTILHPIAYFIVPYLVLLPDNLLFAGIYACLSIRNLLSILAYPVLLILLKQASVSTAVLGRINGLAAAAGAACRTIAPPVAGLLYGWGSEIGFTGLAWWGAGAVAMLGVLQLYFVPREKGIERESVVKPIVTIFVSEETQYALPRDVVDVTVYDDIDEERGRD